jgi:CPA1 family monovalent cation:H+ antiporter
MTFGVVVLSILVQGLTMAPLLRKLRIVGAVADRDDYETHLGAMQAAHAALAELDDMDRKRVVHADVIESLRGEYRERVEQATRSVRELHLEKAQLRAEEEKRARRQLLVTEKDRLLRAFRDGVIGHEAVERLLTRVDGELDRLETGHGTEKP